MMNDDLRRGGCRFIRKMRTSNIELRTFNFEVRKGEDALLKVTSSKRSPTKPPVFSLSWLRPAGSGRRRVASWIGSKELGVRS